MKEYRAYISKVSHLHDDITNSLEFIKWKDSLRNDSTVFIKPNFTYPFYKEGITTNPQVLKEVLAIIKDRAGRVIVGESNGGNHSFTADQSFKGHGMSDICRSDYVLNFISRRFSDTNTSLPDIHYHHFDGKLDLFQGFSTGANELAAME